MTTTARRQASPENSRRHSSRAVHTLSVVAYLQKHGREARRQRADERKRCGYYDGRAECGVMRRDHADDMDHEFYSRRPGPANSKAKRKQPCGYDGCDLQHWEHDLFEPDEAGHEFVDTDGTAKRHDLVSVDDKPLYPLDYIDSVRLGG